MERKKGFIILLLTVTILLLSFSATLTFFSTAFQEYRGVQNEANRIKAIYLAQSGLQVVIKLFDQLEKEGFLESPIPIPLGDGFVSYKAEDLSGKLNINLLVNQWGGINLRQLERFQRLSERLGISGDIWDAVIDWIDEDHTPQPFGYEKSHYQNLDPPRRIKNSWIHSIEELLLIPGFDRNILFSDLRDEEEKNIFFGDDLPEEQKDIILPEDFILANNLSHEIYNPGSGQSSADRININEAPFLVLWSSCEDLNDDQIVKNILLKRREKEEIAQKLSNNDLRTISGISEELIKNPTHKCGIKFNGDLYKIISTGVIGNQTAQVITVYDRRQRKISSYSE